jgi:PAS domain S-box-containing protein
MPKQSFKMLIRTSGAPAILVGLVLAGYIGYLVVAQYRSQMALQQSVLNDIYSRNEKRALALSYFFAERKNELQNLADSRILRAYFENKALGMSMTYGLKASILLAAEQFEQKRTGNKLSGQVIFKRVMFVDAAGNLLIDSRSSGLQKEDIRGWRLSVPPVEATPLIRYEKGLSGPYIIVSVPCIIKDSYAGQIVGWISPALVYQYFIKGYSRDFDYPVAIIAGREYLYLPEKVKNIIPVGTTGIPPDMMPGQPYRMGSPDVGAAGKAMIALDVRIDGTPFSLVTFFPTTGQFDLRTPRQLLYTTGSMAAIILAGMFILLHLSKRNELLMARLEEATLREQAEFALRKSEENYRTLFETSRDAIVIGDETGILDCNSAAQLIFGCTARDELIGKHPGDFSPVLQPDGRDSRATVRDQIAATMAEGSQFFEWTHQRRDGTPFPAEVLLSRSEFSGKPVVVAVIRDISERKMLESQLLHAQKMEAIGKLAGGIAHDFNNILTVITGFGSLLQMKLANDDPMMADINQVLNAADRAANLTRSLLSFSRKQVILLKPVELNENIRHVETFLKRIISEDIELVIRLTETPLVISADSGQIEQILLNFATNARDAMPHGGALTLQTASMEINELFIDSHGYGEPGRYALLSVSDTGEGMDSGTRERIFEPFFTTKEVGKGTGLGLSVNYGIIKQHNGFINVSSEPGRGTTFSIYLPLIAGLCETEAISALPAPLGGDEMILYAEDDDAIRSLATKVLADAGYRVIAAENGEEAVKKFIEHQDAIRLLLLDVIMPKKNGRVTCDVIRAMRPDVKTLFVSGYTADLLQQKGLYEEGMELVMKPIAPECLLRKVREMLDR